MNNHFRTLEELTTRLQHLRGIPVTWHKIAAMDEFGGSSAGLLCNVLLNGYEPKSPLARKKLNLPPLAVPIEPCPDCGDAHRVPYCTKEHGEPDKNYPDEIAYLWQRVQDAERFSNAAHAYAEKLLKELEQKRDGEPQRPKPPAKRKRTPRPRLSIHSTYAGNAGLSIIRKKGNDRLYIERLRDYLSEYLNEEE